MLYHVVLVSAIHQQVRVSIPALQIGSSVPFFLMDAFWTDYFGDRVDVLEQSWGKKKIIGNTNMYTVGNGRESHEIEKKSSQEEEVGRESLVSKKPRK